MCAAAPRLSDGVSKVQEISGSTVTLKFTVTGTPIPLITWQFRGTGRNTMSKRRRVIGDVTYLTIRLLQQEDDGEYTCTAINSLGSATASCQLTVLG